MNAEPEETQSLPDAHITAFNALQGTGLHPHTREALEDMAHEGLPLPLAAKRHSIRPDNLERAFNKPHVRKAYNQLVRAIRDNSAQAAYMRINHLSYTSDSDRIQLDASKWVAGVDGISPVQKVSGQVSVSHSFTGFEYPTIEAKDVTPTDTASDGDPE